MQRNAYTEISDGFPAQAMEAILQTGGDCLHSLNSVIKLLLKVIFFKIVNHFATSCHQGGRVTIQVHVALEDAERRTVASVRSCGAIGGQAGPRCPVRTCSTVRLLRSVRGNRVSG